ncbi:MAG: riboflavin synthase [Phycisphaerae bacterium]|jgi:riboflavin synthase|nr:riboflavin synthase [Phycisphaerae bacterium]
MFTGLVEGIGHVAGAQRRGEGLRLRINLATLAEGVKVGDSINVSGACQTVVAIDGQVADFDSIPETLRLTTLGRLSVGEQVNLERSLAAGAPIGGHFVTGHVDGTGKVIENRASGGQHLIRVRVSAELARDMVPKGSIAIDGVSLTLVDVSAEEFSVALIPLTLRHTTLGLRKSGDEVNIETDILAKYVRKIISTQAGDSSGITEEKLRQSGLID